MTCNFMCRYFSVSIFCKIGLPGFMASISIAVLGIITMVITSIVIDKVRECSSICTPKATILNCIIVL